METLKNSRGTVAIFVTLVMILLLSFIGLAIETGWMAYVRNQGQAAVDAAALSGAAAIPDYNKDGSTDQIQSRVTAFNNKNTVMTQSSGIVGALGSNAEVVTYRAISDSISVPASFTEANGVRVTKSFDVPLFFFRLLNGGVPTTAINVSAVAVIRLKPTLPVNLVCNPAAVCPPAPGSLVTLELRESPSPGDNASFTSYYIESASADQFKEMVKNPATIPCLTMGEPIEINNGQVNSTMQEIKDEFEKNKKSNPPVPGESWPVLLPVISSADLSSGTPTQQAPILKFAWVSITDVDTTGSPKSITVVTAGDPSFGWCPPNLRR